MDDSTRWLTKLVEADQHPNIEIIACMVGIKNAISIKETFPDANVSVLHNDIEVYGVLQEEWWYMCLTPGR